MTTPPEKTLLLVAMPEEAAPLIGTLGLQRDASFTGFTVHRNESVVLGISGIGQHNMTALASLLLAHDQEFARIVNFGCAGAYPEAGLSNGAVALVGEVAKWDLQLPGYETELGPVALAPPDEFIPELPRLRCNSGCSFSTPQQRADSRFPAAELEDMELYGLAVLARAHGLPLISLKFVSNQVGEAALEEFKAGFRLQLGKAVPTILRLLEALNEDA